MDDVVVRFRVGIHVRLNDHFRQVGENRVEDVLKGRVARIRPHGLDAHIAELRSLLRGQFPLVLERGPLLQPLLERLGRIGGRKEYAGLHPVISRQLQDTVHVSLTCRNSLLVGDGSFELRMHELGRVLK